VASQTQHIGGRVLEAELMDDPQLGRHAHVQALRGLSRIYIISRTGSAVWAHVRQEARRAGKPLRVLDIATGGGDLPIDLSRRARREGLALEVAGCDVSDRAVAYARLRARRTRANVRFFTLDIHEQPLPTGYHVITSALFLHHLAVQQAATLLRRMADAATRTMLVDDLRRTWIGLWLARLGTRSFSRSPIVHADGPRSVRAAFTRTELLELAHAAGLAGARIVPHWPQRQLLIWRRT
jgi:2-polyprenyl-3-methyl-5-hydroxy-6-metoxy-1,4-benzoquinol methylase